MKRYNPDQPVDAEQWLARDESERIHLAQDYVARHESEIEGGQLHAMLHVLVENQIVLQDETPVATTLDRLMAEGLDRHEAIHAIAACFTELILAMAQGKPVEPERYFDLVTEQTAEKWLAMAME